MRHASQDFFSMLFVCIGMIAGCGGGGDDGGSATPCQVGLEGCACYDNDTCNGGLVCRSKLCIETSGAGSGGSIGAGGANGEAGTGGVACIPQCGDRKCGPDPACGVSCGQCGAGLACSEGVCLSPQPLKNNGDTCSVGTECASGVCTQSKVGELHCYGTAGANEICGDVYDCAGGLCVPKSVGGAVKVCIPGISMCQQHNVSDDCTISTVAFCQLVQFCGPNNSAKIPAKYKEDFDYCVGSECLYANDGVSDLSPAECRDMANRIYSGTMPCP